MPWVNAWGDETPDDYRIGYDPLIVMPAVFVADHGPVPNFTRMNMGRQRRSAVLGLCQVCTRPVPWSRRNLVLSSVSTQVVAVPGLGGDAVVVFESWLDDRCAEIATTWCPELIRRRRGDDLCLIPVRTKRHTRFVVSTGRVDGHPGAGDKVGMWVKIAIHAELISGAGMSPGSGGAATG